MFLLKVANCFDDLDSHEYFANGIRKRRFCQLKMVSFWRRLEFRKTTASSISANPS